MGIPKPPSPRLKALNKHNTHNVHRDGECYPQFNKNVLYYHDYILCVMAYRGETLLGYDMAAVELIIIILIMKICKRAEQT